MTPEPPGESDRTLPHGDEDTAAGFRYLAMLAETCGVERIADLGDLPPFPELRARVARGDLPPYQKAP